jgi:hypothetical protein
LPVENYPNPFHPPDETIEICRFLEWWKFADLIKTGELYFTRADLFPKDEQECLPSEEYIATMWGVHPLDVRSRCDFNHDLGWLAQLRESFYICCWHAYRGEKAQMWKEYAKDGVAIVSRYRVLKEVLNSMPDQAFLSLVRYGAAHLQGGNVLQYVITKREKFAEEAEVRAMLWVRDEFAGFNRHFDADNRPHQLPLTPPPDRVPKGQRRSVNIEALIERIVVSPWAPPDLIEDIRGLLNSQGLRIPIEPSPLTPYRDLL